MYKFTVTTPVSERVFTEEQLDEMAYVVEELREMQMEYTISCEPIKFKRESRYVVIKTKDILNYLNAKDKGDLTRILKNVADARELDGKQPLECVVVESDWRIYEEVWELIERIEIERQMS